MNRWAIALMALVLCVTGAACAFLPKIEKDPLFKCSYWVTRGPETRFCQRGEMLTADGYVKAAAIFMPEENLQTEDVAETMVVP